MAILTQRAQHLLPNKMKKKVALPLLLMVLAAVTASHISFKKADHSYLMEVDGIEIDAFGKMQNKWLSMTQNCTNVAQVQQGEKSFLTTQQLIQAYSPPQSESAKISSMWVMGDWTLAEVEFEALLPAVVTLRTLNNEKQIEPRGIWSGYTKPWMAAPLIRTYLKTQVPDIPVDLLNCFAPRSKSFN